MALRGAVLAAALAVAAAVAVAGGRAWPEVMAAAAAAQDAAVVATLDPAAAAAEAAVGAAAAAAALDALAAESGRVGGVGAEATAGALGAAAGNASALLGAGPSADAARVPLLLEEIAARAALAMDAQAAPRGVVRSRVAVLHAAQGVRDGCGFALRAPAPAANGTAAFPAGASLLWRRKGDALDYTKLLAGAVLSGRLPAGARASFAVLGEGEAAFAPAGGLGLERLNSRVVGAALWAADARGAPKALALPRGAHVDLLLRPARASHDGGRRVRRRCVFWDADARTWSGEGCSLVERGAVDTCRCSHLTHFAQLASPGAPFAYPGHERALQVLSLLGCALSLLALAGVAATAVVAPHWRHKPENKILLQLSASVALCMALWMQAALAPGPPTGAAGCRALGAVLHYAVLASFCWMLAAGFTHYLRLSTVAGPGGVRRFALLAAAVGWGVPLLPVLVLLAASPGAYAAGADARGLCYPDGAALWAAVVAPLALVLALNAFLFARVLSLLGLVRCGPAPKGLEVRSSGGPGARRLFKRKLLLCVALVALQGLVWVLAPLAAASLFFAYLFCVSAPLQGVVLFAFFGLGERQVRARVSAWAWTKRAGGPGAGTGRGWRAASPAYRGSGTTASTSASAAASASAPDAADAAEALQPLRQAPSPPTSRSRALSLPEINAAPHPRESHL